MDSAVFQQPLFPRVSISQPFNLMTYNVGFGLYRDRNRPTISTLLAFGVPGELSDESSSSLPINQNGSIFSASEDSSSPTMGLGMVDAEITPETINFFVSDAEGDPDCPTEGYSSIEQALNVLRQGKFVIVVDDENGEIEGNLVMAASHVSPEAVAFMVKNGSGIVSVGMKGEDLERLKLPLMLPENEDNSSAPSFTITVDARLGTTTGVSASDRAKTVLALSSSSSKPEDFRRPGHVFPLKYRNGGVLRRAGHTEASVDLVMLAGLQPISLLSAILDGENGPIATMTSLRELASEQDIPIVSITDLIRFRRKREKLVERTAISRTNQMGIVSDLLLSLKARWDRAYSCSKGDIFGSRRCDCGNQLDLAMQLIEQAGRGVVVYLRGHEGRGIGLGHKLQAYNLQDQGHDTVEANFELGFAADAREYGIGAQILRDIGVRTMRLMTNNPAKFVGLKGYGLAVVGRVPVLTPITEENKRYLETKRRKMGHIYKSDMQGPLDEYIGPYLDKNYPPKENQRN